jgi:queuosine precursor transporter
VNRVLAAIAALTFIALVVASNWLTAEYGLVAGLVTAGTFTAGLALACRDLVRETAGLTAALGCVLVGAGLSYWLASPALALASAAAFLLAELFDTALYEPLRRRGRARAVAASQVVGAVVDSVVFLALAGFPLWPAAGTQTVVKWLVVLAPLALIKGVQYAVLRNRLRPQSA